jgi:uncharacterized membrane-anchored protein YitT (DUF2179 family)
MTALTGSAVLAFGLHQVHEVAEITEGGVLGLTLLLKHWFAVSPALSSFVLDALCYCFGAKQLGKTFVVYSLISAGGFSLFYVLFGLLPVFWPQLAELPLLSSIIGAVFVGVGSGLCVRAGGAPSGDDALAMGLSDRTGVKIQWVYLLSDLTVLVLSLSYIPVRKIVFSLITVILSGQIIGWVVQTG